MTNQKKDSSGTKQIDGEDGTAWVSTTRALGPISLRIRLQVGTGVIYLTPSQSCDLRKAMAEAEMNR